MIRNPCGVILCLLLVATMAPMRTIGQEPTGKQEVQPDLKQMRDITGIEELPPAESAWRWLPWVGGAVLVTGGLLLAGWRLRGRPRPMAAPPPDRWALAHLERIEAMSLELPQQAERFHTVVSDVVRRYLEMQFNLRAPRQTTAEFLETMRGSDLLGSAQQSLLRDFLERCDLAKFAPADFTVEECRAAAEMARQIVVQTARPTPASESNAGAPSKNGG